MVVKGFVRFLIKGVKKLENWANEEKKPIYKIEQKTEDEIKTISSIWDFLQFAENTQAYHLINVLGFEEWIEMQEIRRRIKELFNVEYKNERSLYPYLKTLVDLGLVETSSVGGKMKWRKKELVIALKAKKKKVIEALAR